MKKLGLFVSTLMFFGFLASPGYADQRLSLSNSRPLVVMGSESLLVPGASGLSDSGNYDWTQFKYEVLVPSVTGMTLSFKSSRATGLECPGSQVNSGAQSSCEGTLSSPRNVLAAGNNFQSLGSSSLGLRARASVSFTVQVTGWVDSNRDGRISSLEPRTPQTMVTFLPINNLATSINFEIEPGGREIGSKTAWLSDTSGRDGWGRSLSSLLEINRFRVLVERCVTLASACSRAEYSSTYQSHPQHRAWRFDLSSEWAGNELTTVRLAYYETEDDFTVISERVVDYRGDVPASILTGISEASLGNRSSLLGVPPANERWTPVLDSSPSFQYSAVFRKADGSAMANENIDIRVDATLHSSINSLTIDGRPMSELTDPSLTNDSRGNTWITRKTDGQGRVAIELADSAPVIGQSIAIEARVRGYEAHFGGRGGFIERVVWQASKRSLTLTGAIETGGRAVTLTAQLSGADTFGPNRPVVRYQSSSNLLVRDSVLTLGASNRIRIRFSAIAAGTEVVRASVLHGGELYTAELRLSFDGKTGKFLPPQSTGGAQATASITGNRGNWAVRVQNASGLPVSVRVGASWFRFTPNSNDFVFTRSARSGSSVPIAVYVNGQLENVGTVTIR